MGKSKEDIKDIRELIEDVDATQDKITQQQAALDQTLVEVKNLLNELKTNGIKQTSNNIDTDAIVNAIKPALNEKVTDSEGGTITLSAADKKSIADDFVHGLCEHFKEDSDSVEEERKKRGEEKRAALSKQGLANVEEVDAWAPEYSPTVQRWMRWIGTEIFDHDEDPNSVHKALKTIGNALQVVERQEPTLKMYLRSKWKKWKRHIKSFRFWYYMGCIQLLSIAVGCICVYQSKVMDIDRKNAIIRDYFHNDKAYQKEYQHVDSLLHHHNIYSVTP